ILRTAWRGHCHRRQHGDRGAAQHCASVHASNDLQRRTFRLYEVRRILWLMPRICESDYGKVLGVLREASAIDGVIPFPEPVLEALRRLVPCDVVAYHEKLEGDAERTIVFTGEPRGEVTPEVHVAGKRYWHQDPMKPTDGARKYSDYFSRREFHRLELYQEVARPLGVEYMMRLWLSPRGTRQA